MPSPFVLRIHAACCRGDQRRSLIVFIEYQDKIRRRKAVLCGKLVDPLDRLQEDPYVKPVRIVDSRRHCLFDPDIENEAAERCDLDKQSVREMSELCVSRYIRDRVEAGPLLFP